MRSLNIKASNKDYTVNFYNTLNSLVESINKSLMVYLIDENIFKYYSQYFNNKRYYIVPASENAKTLDYAGEIINYLIENGYKTDLHLVVVGGGVLQDLGGFIASIFCRGIKYTLIPTTLLAQADSCIGGKTSINHSNRKNILGTFYPPHEVKICVDFLETLPEVDLKSGYGELIKFYLLNNDLANLNLNNLPGAIEYGLVKKAGIIERDEFDQGERKLLNFGHSFGHALESISNYKIPHGSAVIIGILIANEVSCQMGNLSRESLEDCHQKLIPHINHLKLKQKWFDFHKLLEYLRSDKKNVGNDINMILVNKHGEYNVISISDLGILEKSVGKIYEII